MLEEVQRGWEKFGPEGRFRSAQLTARLKPEHVRQLWQEFVEKAEELEDPSSTRSSSPSSHTPTSRATSPEAAAAS